MAVKVSVRLKFRAFWLCLCLLGNAYQIYHLSDRYFDYDVSTTVNINYPENFEPPASTICFDLMGMVRMNEAMERWPDFKARFKSEIKGADKMSDSTFKATIAEMDLESKISVSRHIFNDIKVEDAFALTYGPDELLLYCRIIKTPSYSFDGKPCHELYSITESFIASGKCFTLKLKIPQVYSYITVQRMKVYQGMISITVMRQSIRNLTTAMVIYTHSSSTYAREGLSRYLLLTPSKLYSVTHSTFTSKLLQAPYDTDCQNYTMSGYVDRGECYEKCVNKQSLDRLGKLTPGPVILLDEFRGKHMIDTATVFGNSTLRQSIIQIDGDCDSYCSKPDCESTYYVPSTMTSGEFNFPALANYVEQQPLINTVYSPRHSIVQYITDLFSTLGFWIGASGLTVFDAVWKILTRARKSKSVLDSSAVQISAIQMLQKQMEMVQNSLFRLTSQRSTREYLPSGSSYGRKWRKYYRQEPMFRTNFFKL
ncbi:hypothetical protein HDE_07600 [Halotydeus destructor]|nr:hypothetical protein HDE_07600 [Halotydeus destructor]